MTQNFQPTINIQPVVHFQPQTAPTQNEQAEHERTVTDNVRNTKSSTEALADVLRVYHDMTNRKIRDVRRQIFEELEGGSFPAGTEANGCVLKTIDKYIQQMEAKHNESSSKAEKMREDLAGIANENTKQLMSTIGLAVEGASMAAELTRAHLVTMRTRFEKECRNRPADHPLEILRRTFDHLETESDQRQSN
jgi:hypothetical protein